MNYSPSFEEVKEIAESGKYDILPVSCEILSDICTPIEALRIRKMYHDTVIYLNLLQVKKNGVAIHFLGLTRNLKLLVRTVK